jgi:hypothetical protein
MMVRKQVLCEERRRQVPEQYSWVDHRLVRDGYCRRCPAEALGLYLLLVTVADAEGVSYYSDISLGRLLQIPVARVGELREALVRADLVAHRAPLYQVLELPEGQA